MLFWVGVGWDFRYMRHYFRILAGLSIAPNMGKGVRMSTERVPDKCCVCSAPEKTT